MKKIVIFFVFAFLITSCVPDPEELAGVTREELMTGKAVEKVLQIKNNEKMVIDTSSKQTLAQAHEKEIVDVAEHVWDDIRSEQNVKVLEDGAIQAGVGEKFKVNLK